jgi:trans-aconitate methyltransferase
LHHTDPSKSLREFQRVLTPGGTLVVQEWADALNQPNKVVFDVLAKYRSAEASDSLLLARAQSERGHTFRTNAGHPDKMTGLVQAAGFSSVEAHIESYAASVANIDALVDLLSASPTLHAEMNALSEDTRTAFLKESREALGTFAGPNGFAWKYNVLVLIAHK